MPLRQEARYHSVFGDLATCSGTRQVRASSGFVKVSARRQSRVSTVPTERHAPQMNPRETSALRRPSSFDGPRPTVTRKSTRRVSRLSDKSPSQPVNPMSYRPDTTDSSLQLGRPTVRRCCHHHDSPYDHHVVVRNAHSSQPSFATRQLRCRIWMRSGPAPVRPEGWIEEWIPSLSRKPRARTEET